MEEVNPPQKTKWIKNIIKWANASKGLIAAAAALLTAVGALLKPQDHSATKITYDTLSVSIKQISDEQKLDHDDIVKLRGYLDGLNHVNLVQKEAEEIMLPAGRKAGGSSHKYIAPKVVSALSTTATSATATSATSMPMAQEPPPVHNDIERKELPSFDILIKK
jgi:hypothetical protein